MLGESANTIKWRYYKAIYTLKITLSNLGMFIITFILGIGTLKNQKKASPIINEDQDTNKVSNEIEVRPSEPVHREDYEDNSIIEDTENKDFIENIIDTTIHTTNYVSIGIFSVSAIFLTLTIIFSIFLAKHQLNAKKKSSK